MITNKSWNLQQGDGKQQGFAFKLGVDEYAIIKAHLMCPGDCLYILEVDSSGDMECNNTYVDLARDGCEPMVITHKNNRVRIAGPGIFKVSRKTKDGEILGQHIEANVHVYKAKSNFPIIENNGFVCN